MIRPATPADATSLTAVWRRAVEATHPFLTPDAVDAIEIDVAAWLNSGDPNLWACDQDGAPVAFLGLSGDELAALFVDPRLHRSGIGRRLVDHALSRGARRLSVNEDNPGARAFYERLGFRAVGRAETDDAGRPYPLILMALSR
ncbi:GNAT family N-acetyltransferase [Brevundimonas pondensis]|uniref:GNAT family N-acetyltransferase n=1 Tax=Brevundimonas pondensis TaxID=2774189 RepID=A0ABX7SJD5_9CAUL|nr:GNAT family N-acetyltransferase [Brevundimonas pondensis]QTC87814.1 GNAT family N-acetyltransferase [Brevundimonas pondensis]